MAVPSSGSLSLRRIAAEKVFDNYGITLDGYAQATLGITSLKDVTTSGNSNGSTPSFDVTNTTSSSYPNGSAPYSMSEFYSYDHDATVSVSSGTLYYSAIDGDDACVFGTGSTYYWSGSGDPVINGYAIYTNYALTSIATAGWYSSSGKYRLWVTSPSAAWSGSASTCPAV